MSRCAQQPVVRRVGRRLSVSRLRSLARPTAKSGARRNLAAKRCDPMPRPLVSAPPQRMRHAECRCGTVLAWPAVLPPWASGRPAQSCRVPSPEVRERVRGGWGFGAADASVLFGGGDIARRRARHPGARRRAPCGRWAIARRRRRGRDILSVLERAVIVDRYRASAPSAVIIVPRPDRGLTTDRRVLCAVRDAPFAVSHQRPQRNLNPAAARLAASPTQVSTSLRTKGGREPLRAGRCRYADCTDHADVRRSSNRTSPHLSDFVVSAERPTSLDV